jgi:heterodisulfide reductase subunit C
MEIDIPSMMDYLRQRSMSEKKMNPKAKNIVAFHKSFLNMIKFTGRSYEVGLVVDYKRRSLKLMQDIILAPKMLLRGKLPLLPESIRGVSQIRKIFKRTFKQ